MMDMSEVDKWTSEVWAAHAADCRAKAERLFDKLAAAGDVMARAHVARREITRAALDRMNRIWGQAVSDDTAALLARQGLP